MKATLLMLAVSWIFHIAFKSWLKRKVSAAKEGFFRQADIGNISGCITPEYKRDT
ncbi:hypothetical protein ACFS07_33090 [Undibacterium arcticum]